MGPAFSWEIAGLSLLAVLAAAGITWLASLARKDVSIVDSVWALMILLAGVSYAVLAPEGGPRETLVLVLAGLWALRLSGYLTWRNWGQGEDRRYQVIRARNQPHFAFKSLYLVFGLQAVLAWIVAWPLMAAIAAPETAAPLGWLDGLGAALWLFGLGYETLADAQLARFKADPRQAGRVMDRGLWRFSRHPNYFGEACVWWGAGLVALGAGAPLALVSPVLMTLLLLKVSGVVLLEQDMAERRPAYADYVARTNAFLPGPPSVRPAPSSDSSPIAKNLKEQP